MKLEGTVEAWGMTAKYSDVFIRLTRNTFCMTIPLQTANITEELDVWEKLPGVEYQENVDVWEGIND